MLLGLGGNTLMLLLLMPAQTRQRCMVSGQQACRETLRHCMSMLMDAAAACPAAQASD